MVAMTVMISDKIFMTKAMMMFMAMIMMAMVKVMMSMTMASMQADAQRGNERAEGAEKKIKDLEEELKVV